MKVIKINDIRNLNENMESLNDQALVVLATGGDKKEWVEKLTKTFVMCKIITEKSPESWLNNVYEFNHTEGDGIENMIFDYIPEKIDMNMFNRWRLLNIEQDGVLTNTWEEYKKLYF